MQARVLQHVHGVGGLNHDTYRSAINKALNARGEPGGIGCIDGDVVERLLELPPHIVSEVLLYASAQSCDHFCRLFAILDCHRLRTG